MDIDEFDSTFVFFGLLVLVSSVGDDLPWICLSLNCCMCRSYTHTPSLLSHLKQTSCASYIKNINILWPYIQKSCLSVKILATPSYSLLGYDRLMLEFELSILKLSLIDGAFYFLSLCFLLFWTIEIVFDWWAIPLSFLLFWTIELVSDWWDRSTLLLSVLNNLETVPERSIGYLCYCSLQSSC